MPNALSRDRIGNVPAAIIRAMRATPPPSRATAAERHLESLCRLVADSGLRASAALEVVNFGLGDRRLSAAEWKAMTGRKSTLPATAAGLAKPAVPQLLKHAERRFAERALRLQLEAEATAAGVARLAALVKACREHAVAAAAARHEKVSSRTIDARVGGRVGICARLIAASALPADRSMAVVTSAVGLLVDSVSTDGGNEAAGFESALAVLLGLASIQSPATGRAADYLKLLAPAVQRLDETRGTAAEARSASTIARRMATRR